MCNLTFLIIFLYHLLGSPARQYFFNDDIDEIEFGRIKNIFKDLFNPLRCLVVDKKTTIDTRNLVYVRINQKQKSFIFFYHKVVEDGFRKRCKASYEVNMLRYENDEELIKYVCKKIIEKIRGRVPVIYYSVIEHDCGYREHYNSVYDYIEDFKTLFKKFIPNLEVVDSLPYRVYDYCYLKEILNDNKETCLKELHTSEQDLDIYSFFDYMNYRMCYATRFRSNLRHYEEDRMFSLVEKYQDNVFLVKEKKMLEKRSHSHRKDALIDKMHENSTGFFYLYVFDMLKNNDRYTLEVVREHNSFFNTLLKFIFNKKTFCFNFDLLYKECNQTEKKEFIKTYNEFIRSNKLKIDKEKVDDGLFIAHRIKECFEFSFKNSKEIDNTELTSKFFSIFLKDFDIVADVSLSKDLSELKEVSDLRENLAEMSINNLNDLVDKFIVFFTGKQDINNFSKYEQGIFDKFLNICKDQIRETIIQKKPLSPLIYQELHNFAKFDNK